MSVGETHYASVNAECQDSAPAESALRRLWHTYGALLPAYNLF